MTTFAQPPITLLCIEAYTRTIGPWAEAEPSTEPTIVTLHTPQQAV